MWRNEVYIRMVAFRVTFVLALAVGLLCGCEKEVTGEKTGEIAVFTADPSVVIARVGDRDITVGDFRQRIEYEVSVYKLTMAKSKHPPKDAEARLAKFAASRAQKALPQLIHCALLDRYLDASCGGRAVAGGDKVVDATVRRYAKKLRRKDLTFESFSAELAVEPGYLRDQLLLPLREEKARLVFDPASTNVTEREIDEGLARLDAYTERAIATNRVMRAACSNAFAAVKSGEDFAAVANRFGAETPSEATEWGWFNRDDFDVMAKDCPAFGAWAFKAKVGEVGGPYELDDGLSIVKVVGHQEGSERVSMAAEKAEEVQLVRINFPLVVENPEPRTREHCRDALLKWKARNAQDRLFEKLFKETEIRYPNGTKLNYRRK